MATITSYQKDKSHIATLAITKGESGSVSNMRLIDSAGKMLVATDIDDINWVGGLMTARVTLVVNVDTVKDEEHP